jgi:glycine cleavage system P protein (glycine dehydrogenase) subunit 2
MIRLCDKLSIEKSTPNRRAVVFNKPKKSADKYLPKEALRQNAPKLPELSELEVVRHFTNLSRLNYSVDNNFYPLGSCTMKYNPKAYEEISANPKLTQTHPLISDENAQGTLELLYNFEKLLCEITALDSFTLQPAAGAHGEWTGILLAKAYFKDKGETQRTEIIVPDSSHGTNPASASLGGFSVATIESNQNGRVDLDVLKKHLSDKTALVMLTVPNTLGLFENEICEISKAVHEAGALLYMDGANFNALIGLVKPGDFGIDIMHLNLHKTFATPHGGGGPGSGVVGVKKHLSEFLPVPKVKKENGKFSLSCASQNPKTIGRVKAFFGNVGVIVRAYCYLRQYNAETLKGIAECAIISANYVKAKLQGMFPAKYSDICMHECVLSSDSAKMNGVKTIDVAKRLLDYGFYAPTIYFPLIVPEALMIEPTETESKDMLDCFIDVMSRIHKESQDNPDMLKNAPHEMPIKRLDEVAAARNPDISWK